ncbi:MAG: hypothetical protein ABEI52_08815 [Halobacteriaceae archaeon]
MKSQCIYGVGYLQFDKLMKEKKRVSTKKKVTAHFCFFSGNEPTSNPGDIISPETIEDPVYFQAQPLQHEKDWSTKAGGYGVTSKLFVPIENPEQQMFPDKAFQHILHPWVQNGQLVLYDPTILQCCKLYNQECYDLPEGAFLIIEREKYNDLF